MKFKSRQSSPNSERAVHDGTLRGRQGRLPRNPESASATIDLSRIRVMTFDCYGTLIDWERGILHALRPWVRAAGGTLDDDSILQIFARAESAVESTDPSAPYPVILRETHHRIASAIDAPRDDAAARAFAASVGDWPAFSDTKEALARLASRRRLIILSNVDQASFVRTNELLGVKFDAIVTAEAVGAYKPDCRMFIAGRKAVESLGVTMDQHLHVAQSLFHDIAPAKALGWRTCFVDRRGGQSGGATRTPDGGNAMWQAGTPAPPTLHPDIVVRSLAELADRMELAG